MEITMKVVKLHDGTWAYELPDGTVVTEEAWNDMDPGFRRSMVVQSKKRSEGDTRHAE